jgi:NitT/TauT family transport system permease protein
MTRQMVPLVPGKEALVAEASPWRAKSPLALFTADRSIKVLSAVTLILIWYAASLFISASVLPSPAAVAAVLWDELKQGHIWSDVWITLTRILLAFSIAMSLALVLGFAMGLFHVAELFFELWIVCGITLPSLVMILTIYMVVGLNEWAAVLGSAIPVVAILTINIWEGVKNIDPKLLEMSTAFRATRWHSIRAVALPQIAPVLMATSRFGLGLVWKMVLFVELLGRSDGIGYKIEFYYQMFNMPEVLAHAILFLLIMIFIEVVLLGEIERRLFKWRPVKRRL